MILEGRDGGTVDWKPAQIGGRRGGSEVYRAEPIELRAGDRVRWTRNDKDLGLVNSRTAEVVSVGADRVSLKLEDGRVLALGWDAPQLRHLDHAWASTVHAFQGRTVDNVIAAMEANHPHLTTQKGFYVEISRARDRAELVTDDAARLRERLEATTGERISALEALASRERDAPAKSAEAPERSEPENEGRAGRRAEPERDAPAPTPVERGGEDRPAGDRLPARPAREKAVERDFGLELEL